MVSASRRKAEHLAERRRTDRGWREPGEAGSAAPRKLSAQVRNLLPYEGADPGTKASLPYPEPCSMGVSSRQWELGSAGVRRPKKLVTAVNCRWVTSGPGTRRPRRACGSRPQRGRGWAGCPGNALHGALAPSSAQLAPALPGAGRRVLIVRLLCTPSSKVGRSGARLGGQGNDVLGPDGDDPGPGDRDRGRGGGVVPRLRNWSRPRHHMDSRRDAGAGVPVRRCLEAGGAPLWPPAPPRDGTWCPEPSRRGAHGRRRGGGNASLAVPLPAAVRPGSCGPRAGTCSEAGARAVELGPIPCYRRWGRAHLCISGPARDECGAMAGWIHASGNTRSGGPSSGSAP